MNICMISDDFIPSKTGVGIHVKHTSQELVKRGHAVVVITTRRPGQATYEEWQGIKIYRTRSLKIFDFYISVASKKTIRSILLANKIRIIHYHYLGILCKRTFEVAQSLPVKNIYTYNMTVDHLVQNSYVMHVFRSRIEKQIINFCNRCDIITVPARAWSLALMSMGITAPSCYISNASGIEYFPKVRIDTHKDSFVVLYVGRLHPEKNLTYLIRAFALFHREHSDAELWCVGHGYLKKDLIQLAKHLNISDRVKIIDHVDHDALASYYSLADVFVLPSLIEPQGMVAIEAMSFGKPVIVTEAMIAAKDLVEENENGFIVNPAQPQDLSKKLAFLKEHETYRLKMGLAGKQKSEQFRTDTIVDQLQRLYLGLDEGIPVKELAMDRTKSASDITLGYESTTRFQFEITQLQYALHVLRHSGKERLGELLEKYVQCLINHAKLLQEEKQWILKQLVHLVSHAAEPKDLKDSALTGTLLQAIRETLNYHSPIGQQEALSFSWESFEKAYREHLKLGST